MDIDVITEDIIKMHTELLTDKNFNVESLLNKVETEKTVHELLDKVIKNLKHHIYKEEKILFPYLVNLAKAVREEIPFEKPYFETVINPIKIMESDHEQIKEGIEQLQKILNDEPNPTKINSSVKEKIKNLIEYINKVIYLENKILFPKALSLENKILTSS
ncbi:Hypothetical protein IALB_0858 [Ignavibacterium album JCM 16511]|uniref:Hemerythrin-like domain-containing protein n=2 Tax=Ignavibacterium album TaxID=591197 RepID=I0AHW3_IGNAJ|nr:Hypothetical protein IALB_0858 [Ignavibacterium album JCM 16511]